jgi:RimJ/RimL family protein N-acetyltransferase
LYELNRTDFERVRPLFRKMDIHLPLQAILAGSVVAPIYVDNLAHPQTALTWTGHRFYLAGAPGNSEFITAARQVFWEKFALRAKKADIDSYMVYSPTEKWDGFITAMLLGYYPIKSSREYYAFKAHRFDWRQQLPPEIELRQVDAALLAERRWKNLDFLSDEMVSERPSVEEFLSKSFGVCLVREDEIIGWCLSEYNTGHRCEVGLATRGDYQHRGLATQMAAAFVDLARAKDVARVGWHCSASNVGSGKTALKAGFEKVADYPVYFGWFDTAVNLAGNGYAAHGRGEYAEALAFYEKALALGDVPDWVYWSAACDAAMLGEPEQALGYLSSAVAHGFDDLEQIQASKYLVSLHTTPGWQELVATLKRQQSAA